MELTCLTFIDDVPLISSVRINTTQHVHQGGFTGTILPHKSMYLAFLHFQIYIVKCLNARECFGYIFHFQ